MMLRPSTAMTKNRGLTPFSQAWSISFGFHSREWLAMSQVWLMRPVIPVPEPPPRTAMAVPGFLAMYSSARIWTRLTMVSEPLIWIIFCRRDQDGAAPEVASPGRGCAIFFISFSLCLF